MSRHERQSKRIWTPEEKRRLIDQVARIGARLDRPLRPDDLRVVRIARRSLSAIKNQAMRMGLYEPTRKTRRWNDREQHILYVLGKKRQLGARTIKARGFFSESADASHSWSVRSVDSIAQKKRREGLVDPRRSRRAKFAKRLSDEEKRQLRRELRLNPEKRTTAQFGREYGVAPSTIRHYRKIWRIKYSWKAAMALPTSQARRQRLADETRQRNFALWKKRKERLLKRLLRSKDVLQATKKARRQRTQWRTCTKCGRKWPASKRFFAPSPKRRDGEIVAIYLRRSCRVCPRRTPVGTVDT